MPTSEIDYENMCAYLRHCEAEGIKSGGPEQWSAWAESVRFRDSVLNWIRFGQQMKWFGWPLWLLFTPSVIGLQLCAQVWVWLADDPAEFP